MPRRQSKFANDKNGTFTICVSNLRKHLVSGSTAPYLGRTEQEVRECANGLALLGRLLTEYMKANRDVSTYASLGVTDAIGIMDFLETGRAHPISRYIEGLRTEEFRAQIGEPKKGTPRKTEFEGMRRAMVVGAVMALQSRDDCKRDPAIRRILSLTKHLGYGLTKAKIVDWQNGCETEGSVGPEAFRNHIMELAEKRGAPLEDVILDCLRGSWDVAFAG
jgi:hypothetical protein